MNTSKRTRAMVESALLTAIAVVFALAGIYIPLLGYALMLLPVPFIIIGTKHGIKFNILSVIVASLIIGIFTEPLRALFIAITAGFNSIILGYMIGKKYPFSKTMFAGSIIAIISLALTIASMSYFFGISMSQILEQTFTMSSELNQSLFKNIGTDPEKLNEMTEMMEQVKNMSIMLLPSSVIFGAVIFTYLNYLVSGVILRRMGYYVERPNKFSNFRLPKNILMGTLVILILTYLVRAWDIVDFESLFINVLYLFFIIYIIQGLAVANFYMEKRGLGRGIRIFITIILITIPNVAMIIMFVGITDVIFNIRKLGS